MVMERLTKYGGISLGNRRTEENLQSGLPTSIPNSELNIAGLSRAVAFNLGYAYSQGYVKTF
jgi:hypothetical protein